MSIRNLLAALCLLPTLAAAAPASVHLGPRPFFLVEDMTDGPLKRELQACAAPQGSPERAEPLHHEVAGRDGLRARSEA